MNLTICPVLRMATFRIVLQAKKPFRFSENDFKDQSKVKDLCQAINSHAYGIKFNSPDNSLERLNELLESPNYYNLMLQRSDIGDYFFSLSGGHNLVGAISRLAKATEAFRGKPFTGLSEPQQQMVRKLNRLVLELTYSPFFRFWPESAEIDEEQMEKTTGHWEETAATTGTGFVIHSGEENTLAITATHVIEELTEKEREVVFQAEIYNGKFIDINLIAANQYNDIALLSFPAYQIGEKLPALPLARKIPIKYSNRSVLCLGFSETEAKEPKLIRGVLVGRPSDSTLEILPGTLAGFSGGPVIHDGKVFGFVRSSGGWDGFSSSAQGLCSKKLLTFLKRWSVEESNPGDFIPYPIPPSLRDTLTQLTRTS